VVPRVLVVQTRAEVARTDCAALAAAGCEAIAHASGQGVMRAIEAQAPHAVLVDLTLPALDGWCVLAEIGGSEAPPFIVVRGGDPDDTNRAAALGADAWVGDETPIVAVAGKLVRSIAA
jgi:DNA-binding response OmpR family regulator